MSKSHLTHENNHAKIHTPKTGSGSSCPGPYRQFNSSNFANHTKHSTVVKGGKELTMLTTDSQITESRSNSRAKLGSASSINSLPPRQLKPWDDEDANKVDGSSLKLEEDPEFNKQWDQFESNKILFGIYPSVGVEEKYTIPIDRSAPDFKEREAYATKMSKLIESEHTTNAVILEDRKMDHTGPIDEEIMYSAATPYTPSDYALPTKQQTHSHNKKRNQVPFKSQYRHSASNINRHTKNSKPSFPISSPLTTKKTSSPLPQTSIPQTSPPQMSSSSNPKSPTLPSEQPALVDTSSPLPPENPAADIPSSSNVSPPPSFSSLDTTSPPSDDTHESQSPPTSSNPPTSSSSKLNIFAEEFTPSSSYKLYATPHTQPLYPAVELQPHKYYVPPPMSTYRHSHVYNVPDPTATALYQPNFPASDYCQSSLPPQQDKTYFLPYFNPSQHQQSTVHPQPYPPDPNSDQSKYYYRQPYYTYPVSYYPQNFVPVSRVAPQLTTTSSSSSSSTTSPQQ